MISMYDLICDVISCCVSSCAMQVQSMYMIKSWLKARKKENIKIN